MKGLATFNADIIANGAVYANGPVFVQGIDVHKALAEINERIDRIENTDLPLLKTNITLLLKDFNIDEKPKSLLQKLANLIEQGKSLKEILEFIKTAWLYLGPIITDILLKK